MGASEISAGKAFLRLLVDDKEFAKGLDDGLRKLEGFSKSALKVGAAIGAAGAAITGPLIGAVATFASVGSALGEMSERTGVSVEKLSALKYAASQSGTSLEAVERALKFMAKSGQDVNTFDQVAKKIAAIQDPSERTQAALKAFGKSGAELVPMLTNLGETEKKASALGLVMSTLSATHAKQLQDAFGTLKEQGIAFASAIGAALAPAITKALGIISNALPAVIEFAKTHRGLVTAVAAAGAALTAIGTVITVTSGLATAAAASVRALAAALLFLAKNPWAIVITAALAALGVVLGPMIDKWIANAVATDTSAESTKAHTAAIKDQNAELEEGNKKLDKRAAAIAGLTLADRNLVAQSDARRAKQAHDLELVDLQIAANDELIRSLKERGEFESLEMRRANERAGNLKWQRDEISGDADKKRADAAKKADEEIAKSRDELLKRQEQVEKARQEHFNKLTGLKENIQSQFDSFSRPTIGTFSGRLAGQIFGTTIADSREEKKLKIADESRGLLKEIRDELKKPGGLMVGNG